MHDDGLTTFWVFWGDVVLWNGQNELVRAAHPYVAATEAVIRKCTRLGRVDSLDPVTLNVFDGDTGEIHIVEVTPGVVATATEVRDA